jgi:Uma2 family endonuclease
MPVRSRTLEPVGSLLRREEVSAVSVPVATGLTYQDLASFPQDDGLRRELIDGELFVSPSPIVRHQQAVLAIAAALHAYARVRGGLVLPAPMDVVFADDTAVQPDVVYLSADRVGELTAERIVGVVPDLLVEVSSPSTRRLDLIKKRNLYERERVPEYWFVDLEADQVDVHRLDPSGHYGQPRSLGEGDTLTCLAAPGFALSVDEALAR